MQLSNLCVCALTLCLCFLFGSGVVQSNESSAKVDDLVASNAAPTEGSADAEDDKKAVGEMGSEEKPSEPTTMEAPQQEGSAPGQETSRMIDVLFLPNWLNVQV
ncbi:hypothetical protein GUJ93_ZPchr0001g29865 [Zizania palustris]|uniref:Uncharacterized protein n=1 Tax=Zizania palustris TaxID=103762 RepID=A0A8J5V044_ZIZPA|nr:hypothetical protein GUJ93_ZPchr0001g29865 [Zizania palustris]